MDECVSPVNVVLRSFICLFFLLQRGFYKMKRTVFTITLECLSKYYTNLLALPIFFFIVRIAKARLSLKSDNKNMFYTRIVTSVYQSLPLLTSTFHPIILIDISSSFLFSKCIDWNRFSIPRTCLMVYQLFWCVIRLIYNSQTFDEKNYNHTF